jgi:SAM-dependent methyltransferase
MSRPSFDIIREAGYEHAGFSAGYDEHRPSPPAALLDLLSLVAQVERPRLVVDVGSGTGLSTRVWADRAEEVVGIEPSDEMRARAEAATPAPNVRYVRASSDATGLMDECADIVTCSQSLHWMQPEPTFAEAARILRFGGVFAAYDYDWPPIVHWEVERAFVSVLESVEGAVVDKTAYRKSEHLARMNASGRFRYTREATLQGVERGSAQRLVGMAFSIGPLAAALRAGASEEEVGVAALRATAERVLGDRDVTWFMCYRVRYGVK